LFSQESHLHQVLLQVAQINLQGQHYLRDFIVCEIFLVLSTYFSVIANFLGFILLNQNLFSHIFEQRPP